MTIYKKKPNMSFLLKLIKTRLQTNNESRLKDSIEMYFASMFKSQETRDNSQNSRVKIQE